MPRICGECTKCCEGWLRANIKGNILHPTNSCIFLSSDYNKPGCSIHEIRPIKPCRVFNCYWILKDMPEEFKPSKSNVILKQDLINKIPYVFIINAPGYPSEELINWCKQNIDNLLYFNKKDEPVLFGSDQFLELMKTEVETIQKEYLELSKYYNKD